MHAVITGESGFVGGFLRDHLMSNGDAVVAIDADLDITDRNRVFEAFSTLTHHKIEGIYHLAALANVEDSFGALAPVFEVNVVGTVNVLEAARKFLPGAKVVVVSSSEVYGTSALGSGPISEENPLWPLSPYAASKVASEFVGMQAMRAYGQHVIIARPFNHIGPGQSDRYVVSALAKRIVSARAAGLDSIFLGNMDSRRDFSDVRDVVKAYRSMMLRGRAGAIYNICSGKSISIEELATAMLALANFDATLKRDPTLTRQVEVSEMTGDNTRIVQELGWQPEIPIVQSLRDVLLWWSECLDAR